MRRRDFLKYLGIGAGGAGLGFLFGHKSKNPPAKLVPYLVPPEDIAPGDATWYASLCKECGAGCGILVKVMDGRAKKIEGNPLHPVNRGKLCARGQTLPQSLYNPDRVKGPLKRSGERGKGEFTEVSWDEGISILSKNLAELAKNNDGERLFFVTSPLRGSVSSLVGTFMASAGSSNSIEYELFDRRNLAYANQVTMGVSSIPHYDIENTKYILSFGADLSATGISPVNHSYAYGQMRQGAGERGRLVQVEPKLSLTGANADEWVPAKPGTEGVLALSIAYAILEKGLYKGSDAGSWRAALGRFNPRETARITDVDEKRVHRIAREFMETRPSMAIGGETVSGYDTGVSAIVAANILNHFAGTLGSKGGVIPNPEGGLRGRVDFRNNIGRLAESASAGKVKTLLVYNANPLFTAPRALKLEEALNKVPFIVSFSSFMDETAAFADLVLPSHTCLEDWGDDFADPSVGYTVATIMQPAVSPVFNTMGLGDIIISAAKGAGGRLKDRMPSKGFSDYLQDSWREMYNRNREMSAGTRGFDDFWDRLLSNGGWWPSSPEQRRGASVSIKGAEAHINAGPASFEGDGGRYPFFLMVYPSAHLDGRGANIPWLQELPDPMTSVVWGSWLEMNPLTAADLGIKEGDMVSVESPYGRIKLPVYLYPGIRPDTVSIPAGQGHTSYGRYAKDRGANPIELLPAKLDPRTGSIPLHTTRVSVKKTGEPGRLVKYEGSTNELGRGIVKTVSNAEFKKMKKEVI